MDPLTIAMGAATLFKAGSSIFGGMSADKAANDAAKAQNQQNKQNWKFQVANIKADYEYALKEAETARINDDNLKTYQEQTNLRNWGYDMAIREYEFGNRAQAFAMSELQYGARRKYNEQAYENALDQQALWMSDRQLEYSFAMNDLAINMENTETQALMDMVNLSMQAGEINNSRDQGRAKAAFNAEAELLKTATGAARASMQGAPGNSSQSAANAVVYAGSMNQAEIATSLMFDEKALALQGGKLAVSAGKNAADMAAKRKTFNANILKVGETLLSAAKANQLKVEDIITDRYNADLKALAQRMLPPIKPPALPKPLKIPRLEILDPRDPIYPEKPVKVKGSGNSNTISGVLNAGAAVAGGASDILSIGD